MGGPSTKPKLERNCPQANTGIGLKMISPNTNFGMVALAYVNKANDPIKNPTEIVLTLEKEVIQVIKGSLVLVDIRKA